MNIFILLTILIIGVIGSGGVYYLWGDRGSSHELAQFQHFKQMQQQGVPDFVWQPAAGRIFATPQLTPQAQGTRLSRLSSSAQTPPSDVPPRGPRRGRDVYWDTHASARAEAQHLLKMRTQAHKDVRASLRLVHFWASWCEPCGQEFPSLLKLAQQKAAQVQLVAISLDKNREEALQFLHTFAPELAQSRPSNVHLILDKRGRLSKAYGLQAVPETYIVSADLKLLRKVVGELNWLSADTLAYFESL